MTACPYCDGPTASTWRSGVRDRLGFVPGTWSFVRCHGCGSARLDPLPRAEDLGAFYPPVYGVDPPGTSGGLKAFLSALPFRLFYRPLLDAQFRLVLRGTGLRRGRGLRLLDVGCGRGLRLPAFRGCGFEVVGMDFTPTYLETLAGAGIPCFCSDFDHLPDHVGPESFDLVTAFHVFEHVADVRGAVEACRRVLRPGGWLVAAVPLADSWQAALFGGSWVGVGEAPRHVTIPSQLGLWRLLSAAGFVRRDFCPDAALNVAGMIALSALPGAAHSNRPRSGLTRGGLAILGPVATAAALPLAVVEGCLLGRPGAGLFFAQRPPPDPTPGNP